MARGDKTLEIKFRIDPALNDEVRRAAAARGWGISEEIRHRLSPPDTPAGVDDPTKRLLNAIAGIARDVRDAYDVGWRDPPGDPLANRVFIDSVLELLDWANFAPAADEITPRAAKSGSVIDRLQKEHPDRPAISTATTLGTIAAGREGFI